MSANALRGEADVRIGDVDLVIAVEFDGLARVSKAIGAQSMDEVYRRLFGFEPFAVATALHCLAVHAEGRAKAMELGGKAAMVLSAADEQDWRHAIEIAFAGHLDAGRKLRGEPSLAEQAAAAAALAEGKKKTLNS